MKDRDTQVKVKICGMTNLNDVKVAVDGGVDAVGFIFYKKSPRSVTIPVSYTHLTLPTKA